MFAEALFLESLAGIQDELITFDTLTTFFGSNGTGKTSVLKKVLEIVEQKSMADAEGFRQPERTDAMLFFKSSEESNRAIDELLGLAEYIEIVNFEEWLEGKAPQQQQLDIGARICNVIGSQETFGKNSGLDFYLEGILKYLSVSANLRREIISESSKELVLALGYPYGSPRWCAYGALNIDQLRVGEICEALAEYVPNLREHITAAVADEGYAKRLTGSIQHSTVPDFFILNGRVLLPLFGMGFRSNFGAYEYAERSIEARDILRRYIPAVTDTRNANIDFAKDLDNAVGHIAAFLVDWVDEGVSSNRKWGDGPSKFPWLDSVSVSLYPGQGENFISQNDSGDLCVSAEVFRAIELLSNHVNSLVPTFISREFDIEFHLIHPSIWDREDRRVQVLLRRKGASQAIEAEQSGSGIFLWLATSVKIASEMLLNGHVLDLGDGSGEVSDLEIYEFLDKTMILIDEPEAFLHPTALYSVREWIQDMTARSGQVVMATHSVHMFDVQTFNSTRKLLLRGSSESPRVAVLDFSKDASGLSSEAEEIGVTAGDLFLLTKQFLFVEGEVDKRVLNQWFKEEFAWAGVKVIALHSDRNAKKVFESQLVKGIGADIRYLFDKRIPGLPHKDPENDLRMRAEKGFLKKDLEEQDMIAGVRLRVPDFRFKYHEKYDIWWYLNEDLIRQVLNLRRNEGVDWDFTTWDDAWTRFLADIEEQEARANSQRSPVGGTKSIVPSITRFKDFLIRTQDFHLERFYDAERIAEAQFKAGLVPEELKRIIDDLIFRI